MYHSRLTGNYYEMGRKRAKAFQKKNLIFPCRLDVFQLEHGRNSEKILMEYFPQVCAEIRGVTDTLGLEYLPFISWMLCMGCCMYNLKDNIPMEIRGCTAFALEKEGRVLYGRNNDLPSYLKKKSTSDFYLPQQGNGFLLNTSSFINGEEGLNEKGLAVAMTFVMTELEQIRAGFNSCFIVRYLLEKADNTKEALSLLEKLPIASNGNILLADEQGEIAVVEYTPEKKVVRSPMEGKGNRFICTVNRFITENMKGFDGTKEDDYFAYLRYQTVVDYFTNHFVEVDMEQIKGLLKGDFGFMCQYDDSNFETIWSSIFDLKNRKVYRAEGDPRKKFFQEDTRLLRFLDH